MTNVLLLYCECLINDNIQSKNDDKESYSSFDYQSEEAHYLAYDIDGYYLPEMEWLIKYQDKDEYSAEDAWKRKAALKKLDEEVCENKVMIKS